MSIFERFGKKNSPDSVYNKKAEQTMTPAQKELSKQREYANKTNEGKPLNLILTNAILPIGTNNHCEYIEGDIKGEKVFLYSSQEYNRIGKAVGDLEFGGLINGKKLALSDAIALWKKYRPLIPDEDAIKVANEEIKEFDRMKRLSEATAEDLKRIL